MTDDGEAAKSDGEALKSAREGRGLSVGQVAEELRLTPAMIDAMDGSRWSELGAAVYARGHLRKYAALVGVEPSAVLAAYEAEQGRNQPQQLIPPASVHTPVDTGFRWRRGSLAGLTLVAAALLIAAAWWLYQRGRSAEEPVVEVAPAELPAAATSELALDAAIEPAAPPAAEEPVAAESAESAPDTSGAAAAITAGPATEGRLGLSLAAESWVEIYDASGAQLEFGLKDAGTARTYGGVPPWRLVLGNAPAVTLTLAGTAVEIPPGMIIRRAALITIDAEGQVRRSAAGSSR